VDQNEEELVSQITREFSHISSQGSADIKFIKLYKIKNALPVLDGIRSSILPSATRIQDNIYLAGDHLLNGSLNAAMASGRAAAQAVLFN
jgi:protoporphyrinogen oxidase